MYENEKGTRLSCVYNDLKCKPELIHFVFVLAMVDVDGVDVLDNVRPCIRVYIWAQKFPPPKTFSLFLENVF